MIQKQPSLNALRAFEATARLGSVSLAAHELHVTHGAISRQIGVLEDALGYRLFERQGRNLMATAAAHRLRDSCSTAFSELSEAWAALHQNSAQAPFVLGCPGSLLARWVIPRLDRLARELPSLKLHLSAQEEPFSPQLSGLDAALLLTTPPWPTGWHVHELAPERIGPVFSPRYPNTKHLLEQSGLALIGEPLLYTASRPQAWSEWASAMDIDAAELKQTQSFPHLYHLLEAAVAGLGVAIAPAPLVADELVAGRLLAPWGFRTTAGYWILATRQRVPNPKAELLASWLQSELAGG
jgi:DNA-binding transcriptional LysR family regulator